MSYTTISHMFNPKKELHIVTGKDFCLILDDTLNLSIWDKTAAERLLTLAQEAVAFFSRDLTDAATYDDKTRALPEEDETPF